MTQPVMRGSQIHANLTALSALGAEEESAIRAVASEAVKAIEASIAVAWLPIEFDLQLTEAVVEVVGHDRMREWAANSIAQSTQGPLLGPLLRTLNALGLTPASTLHRIPLGWSLVYRNCGAMDVQTVDAQTVMVRHVEPPGEMTLSLDYRESIGAAFEGLMVIGGAKKARAFIESEPRLGYRCVYS
ncbi:MAG: hypothetical protein AB8I08_36495 [Sandaracinaceae bacterium]